MAGMTKEERHALGLTISPDSDVAPMDADELGLINDVPAPVQQGPQPTGFNARPQKRITPAGLVDFATGQADFQDTLQEPFSPGTAAANVPGSAADVLVSGAETVTSPLQTLGIIKSGLQGAADVAMGNEEDSASVELPGGVSTTKAELAREMGRNLTRMLRDPVGTFEQDPVGAMLDLSAVTKPAMLARLGGVGRTAEFLRYVDPAEVAVVAVSKGGKKSINLLGDLLEARAGQRSGVGGIRVATAREAGRAGGEKAKAFKDNLKGGKEVSDLVLDYERGIAAGKDVMAQRFKEDTAKLKYKNPHDPVNPPAVRKDISNMLEQTWGVKIKPKILEDGSRAIELDFSKTRWKTRPDKQERIRQAYEVMKDWGNASIDGSHLTIQQLDELIERGVNRANFEGVNAVVQGMRQRIRDELGNKIEGYNFRAQRYAQMKQFLEETEKALGLNVKRGPLDFIGIDGDLQPINTKSLTRIGNAMNERLSGSNQYNRALVEEIDNVIETAGLKQRGFDLAALPEEQARKMARERGLPSDGKIQEVRARLKDVLVREHGLNSNLSTELAAVQLRDLSPQGIARVADAGSSPTGAAVGAGLAHMMGFGGIETVVGAATGSAVGRLLSVMTIENPRAVGNFFYGLGATERLAGQIVKELNALRDNLTAKHKVTNAALASMSVAEAVNRAMKETSKKARKRHGIPSSRASRFER